jgi:acetyl-CoA carboxylase biotin carboxyl carrier protein
MRPAIIRELIKLVEDSEIDALEVSSWGRRVKITRKQVSVNGSGPYGNSQMSVAETVAAPQAPSAPIPAQPSATTPAVEEQSPQTGANLVEIKSPMVGTFYSSPSPESPPFVQVGDSVSAGAVVCIVEAMKLMNEIESEVTGKISKSLVENGQPVEFGQPLYLVDASS